MKSRIALAAIILLTFCAIRPAPTYAACPTTTNSADTVTNPATNGCNGDDWNGMGGDDVMTNNGSVGEFSGDDGNNTLTNSISGAADDISGTYNGTGNGTVYNYGTSGTIIGDYHSTGNGTVYNYGTSSNYVSGNDESTGNGIVYNYGTVDSSIYGNDDPHGDGVYGTVYNYGTAHGDVWGIFGPGHIGSGTVYNFGTTYSAIYGNSYAVGNGTIINSGTVHGDLVGKNSTGAGNSTVVTSGTVTGNIYGSIVPGSIGNSSIEVLGGAYVGGFIQSGSGDDSVFIDVNATIKGNIDGGDGYDTLTFGGVMHDEGAYDAFLAELATKNPNNGSITFEGRTYTWQNFEELQNLLKLLLNITWFAPTDGRLDPHPAERIAVYCHADKNTIGVLLVDGSSQGNLGVSFKIDALKALGSAGTAYSFGSNGTLSIMMDSQGNGYAAWNGGSQGANGQGVFAKSFTCQ